MASETAESIPSEHSISLSILWTEPTLTMAALFLQQ
jgi:hypothetical protein